jgi:GNAT superfamily N-acetyltransferase
MLIIRRATEADQDSIWKVHTSAIRNVCCSHYSSDEIEDWVGRLKPESYGWPIQNKDVFVAEIDGEVVGFGQVIRTEVEAVYVSPNHLRAGIGSQILATLEQRARVLGSTYLEVLSSLNAVSFYEESGYRTLEPATYMLNPGRSIACVRMAKNLETQLETSACR